jgi:hypothetical protein
MELPLKLGSCEGIGLAETCAFWIGYLRGETPPSAHAELKAKFDDEFERAALARVEAVRAQ